MLDHCIDMGFDVDIEFCNQKWVVAKKEHECVECDQPILPGTRYEYAVGKSGGDFWSVKTCSICVAVRDDFVSGSYVFGELWSEMRQLYGLDYDEILEDKDGSHGWDRWEGADSEWAAHVKAREDDRSKRKLKYLETQHKLQENQGCIASDHIVNFLRWGAT